MQTIKRAIIDIGSNSVRIMTSSGKKLLKTTQLASGLAVSGVLRADKMEETAEAVREFCEFARSCGDTPFAFATEGVRSAKNGNDFVRLVQSKVNLPVRILSGDEEAAIGFAGAVGDCADRCAVIDIGGASTEFIVGEKGKILYRLSLPVGVVRLKDLFGDDRESLVAYIKEQVKKYKNPGQIKTVFAIGGTATSLAALDMNLSVYDSDKTHLYILTRTALSKLAPRCLDQIGLELLDKRRAEVIGYGAVELLEIIDFLKISQVTVSEKDNLDGFFTVFPE